MSVLQLSVLFEDNHLLVLNKPAGLPTMGVAAGEDSLWLRAKDYIKEKYQKPGKVFLGVVSRLDADVTGVVIFARTSKGAARLSEQYRKGTVEKIYWAIVEKAPHPSTGNCEDRLQKNESQRKMVVTDDDDDDGRDCRLTYRTLQKLPTGALLEVQLETGRKHQIRVQLSSRGWPIIGDRKYGSHTQFPNGIALHARQLTISHPTKKELLTFAAPPPKSWQQFRIVGQD